MCFSQYDQKDLDRENDISSWFSYRQIATKSKYIITGRLVCALSKFILTLNSRTAAHNCPIERL